MAGRTNWRDIKPESPESEASEVEKLLHDLEAEATESRFASSRLIARHYAERLRAALRSDSPVSFAPTEKPHFCNRAGPMGQDGCKDSWMVGGNYGSPVCRNPDHHDRPASTGGERDSIPESEEDVAAFCMAWLKGEGSIEVKVCKHTGNLIDHDPESPYFALVRSAKPIPRGPASLLPRPEQE